MIGKWFLPLPFIFANKNYTLTLTQEETPLLRATPQLILCKIDLLVG